MHVAYIWTYRIETAMVGVTVVKKVHIIHLVTLLAGALKSVAMVEVVI